jgi:hypothetical protein
MPLACISAAFDFHVLASLIKVAYVLLAIAFLKIIAIIGRRN